MWNLRVESYQFIQKVTDGYNFSVLQFTTEANLWRFRVCLLQCEGSI